MTSKMNKKRILAHCLMWVLFALLFLVSFSGVQPLEKSVALVASIMGFSLPAVYFHFYLVEKLLRKKRILLYILSIVALLLFYGRFINYIVETRVFPNDEGTYIVGEFILVVFLLMASGLHYSISGLQAKSQLAESEAKKTKAELNSLKLQLSPHFLFNSLNNIYGLMEDDSDAAHALLKLSSLLRYMLDSSNKTMVKLEEEVRFIEDYMAMERLRLNGCEVQLTREGSLSSHEISPFLMIPFVENAFKHGKLNAKDSFIHVVIHVESDELHFNIQNSSDNSKQSGHQIGINNVRRRLELLDKPYTLEVDEGGQVFGIKLKLSL